MKIKRFNESLSIKAENIDGDVILYRLSSHSVIDLSEPGGSINVDNYYRYNEANYDPDNIETKTALCAVPDVVSEQVKAMN